MSSSQQQLPVRSYGVTEPISLRGPDPNDYELTRKLEETLKDCGYFESDIESSHRIRVMTEINALVEEWIRSASLTKNISPEIANTVGGRVCTFGSYRLGVHSKGGDIDTLLIAPRHIERIDFFQSFAEKLRRLPVVRDFRCVEDAYVPVIKMTYDGIELDMLFARLSEASISNSLDLKDDQILRNLDPRCARSLNGCRVTDEILDLVPNREIFRATLRAIKLWAKRNGLYSNALGFFGGVTWAMLVARVCQLYPNAVAATLVNKFFLVFSRWEWPSPVLLKSVKDARLGFPIWDPTSNVADRYHLMPIITPAYPQQNSTHNVSLSTQKIIVSEIQRGLKTVTDIMNNKLEWKELFIGLDFFQRYKHYIILLLSAPDQSQFLEWSGLVEAKIRILITHLERNPYIDIAHVCSEQFKPSESVFEQSKQQQASSNHTSTPAVTDAATMAEDAGKSPSSVPSVTNFTRMWVVGLQFKNVDRVQLDLTDEIRSFTTVVYKAANSSLMSRDNIILDARYIRKRDLHTVLPHGILKPSNSKTKLKNVSLPHEINDTTATAKIDGPRTQSPCSSPLQPPPLTTIPSVEMNGSSGSPAPDDTHTKVQDQEPCKVQSPKTDSTPLSTPITMRQPISIPLSTAMSVSTNTTTPITTRQVIHNDITMSEDLQDDQQTISHDISSSDNKKRKLSLIEDDEHVTPSNDDKAAWTSDASNHLTKKTMKEQQSILENGHVVTNKIVGQPSMYPSPHRTFISQNSNDSSGENQPSISSTIQRQRSQTDSMSPRTATFTSTNMTNDESTLISRQQRHIDLGTESDNNNYRRNSLPLISTTPVRSPPHDMCDDDEIHGKQKLNTRTILNNHTLAIKLNTKT